MRAYAKKSRKIKIQYQYDTMDCGIACMAMIADYYGIPVSRAQLSELCKGTRNGLSFLSIQKSFKMLGVIGDALSLRLDDINSSKHLPAILHWNDNHFVVLYEISRNHGRKQYKIADPSFGYVKFDQADMLAHWCNNVECKGRLMYFHGGEVQFTPSKSDKSQHIKRIYNYVRQYRAALTKIGICVLVVSLLQLVLPFTTQAIVDVGIELKNIKIIYVILLAQLMIIVGRVIGDFIRKWLLLRISVKINLALITDFFIKLVKLPIRFFDTKKDSDLLQRIDDHKVIESFITTKLLDMIFSLTFLTILIGVLFFYNIKVFAIFLSSSVIYVCWILMILQKRKLLNYKFYNKRSKCQSGVYQIITGIEEMKINDCAGRKLAEWQSLQLDLLDLQSQSLKLEQFSELGNLIINEGKNLFITAVSASSVISGEITIGVMLSIQYIIGQLSTPVENLARFIFALQDIQISFARVTDVYDRHNEVCDNHISPLHTPHEDLIVENVCFNYDDSEKTQVINHLSCVIKKGKLTAIVGPSGSGKTTLIKLLLKYYKPDTGEIFVGPYEYSQINSDWWRSRCSVVMQGGFIFSDTIARNIAPKGDIIHTRLEYAARVANIYDAIISLPNGFETYIGLDGQGLSEGQKQRLLIARAVYKDAPYVFFDEATNSLDTRNERVIVDNLKEFYGGKTVVVVAHRLSTVKSADEILVMDQGRIVEQGTHDELIEVKGLYYDLVKNQLEIGTE